MKKIVEGSKVLVDLGYKFNYSIVEGVVTQIIDGVPKFTANGELGEGELISINVYNIVDTDVKSEPFLKRMIAEQHNIGIERDQILNVN